MTAHELRGPLGNGVYGLQAAHGIDVIQGSHECGKIECRTPNMVAVFGKLDGPAGMQLGRINVCRDHILACWAEFTDPWMAALLGPRDGAFGEYCPHCCARKVGPQGQGHNRFCPIGLTSKEFARAAGSHRQEHSQRDCEVCDAYLSRKPGPVG